MNRYKEHSKMNRISRGITAVIMMAFIWAVFTYMIVRAIT